MTRDLSPPQWLAPGTASLALSVLMDPTSDPMDIDLWKSDYSVCEITSLTWSVGNNAVNITGDGNTRILILIPPRNNDQSLGLRAADNTGTAISLNPNGPLVLSFPATSQQIGVSIVAGGNVNGAVRAFLL